MTHEGRYGRQISLAHLGRDGQDRISRASVLCIGAGGLGAPVLLYLAAAGIGRIGIIDDDRISLSNLQRQIIFSSLDLGKSKAEIAREKILALNPEIQVEAFNERLDAMRAAALFPRFDVIVDCSDNFATKFLCNDACVLFRKPLVYGSVLQWEGHVSVFDARKGPCYRCLYPEEPQAAIPNCAQAGVIGALAGIIGSAQALEALKIILSDHLEDRPGDGLKAEGALAPVLVPWIGKLGIFDGARGSWSEFTIPKNRHCGVCSRAPGELHLSDSVGACAEAHQDSLSAEALGKLLAKNPASLRLIDLREEEERMACLIERAEAWPFSRILKGEFPARTSPGVLTVLYCESGIRSETALRILRKAGFEKLTHLRGGFRSWAARVRV